VPPRSKQRSAAPSAASLQSEYRSDDPNDPFAGQAELPLDVLVAEVQARNPSVQAASAAWRAAAERYPQVVSLDDPMFNYMISPSGVGTMDNGGWMVQASQQIPWPGKRALRGSVAAAETEVARGDIGDTRLRLSEAARIAFFDYYLAWRQAEVNQSTRQLVRQLREIAVNKYEVGQVTQQDVLQADVELADLATRSAELTREQQVASARINTLLHRAADYPLPPPAKVVPMPDGLPAAESLQEAAARSRPDLYSQLSRIRAEEANLALACKEYYPDVNMVARYDGFMPEDMRSQVGMDINVPIRYARRSAAVREASNRIAQQRAEYQNRLDQVRYEVQAAFTRVVQAAEIVRLYRDQTLPASERNLESAQANYTTGNLDFLRLLDAERQLNNQRERYYAALAEYHRRLAELERAVGEPVR
jgi:outer membrane protein TolC